jgi:choline dehydrogenase
MSFNTCRPTSRGSVHIRSSDPQVTPLIVPNSLTSAADVQDVYDGARLLRRLSATGPLAAVTESEREPGKQILSDAEVLADFRQRAGSVFHASCSCAMGADPRTSVLVAPQVRGVSGLRVVDASTPQRHLRQHQCTHHNAGRRLRSSFSKTVARGWRNLFAMLGRKA